MKFIYSLFITFLFLFLWTTRVKADFRCTWTGSLPQPCIVDTSTFNCTGQPNACTPWQNFCAQFTNQADCNDATNVCDVPPAQQACSPAACSSTQQCFNGTCPSGWVSTPGVCTGGICCKQQNVTPTPAPTTCFRCVVDTTNYCVVDAPRPDGSCRFFDSETECDAACNNPSEGFFSCNVDGFPQCEPASQGNAQFSSYEDCFEACRVNSLKIFCDTNGTATTVQTGKLYTAIGCIPVTGTTTAIKFFLTFGISVGGGFALILIIIAGIIIKTSQGNPQRLQAGKELLISAVTGLLLIIFSAFILRYIGVNIFGIPQLSN